VRVIKAGDQVLFNAEDRFEVEVQGQQYLILRERDIHAVASEQTESNTGLYLQSPARGPGTVRRREGNLFSFNASE
jgi:hypothetical protein